MPTPRADSYSIATGASLYAGRAAMPAWRPAPGDVAQIGYAKGAHPQSLPAVIEQLSTAYQSWNPDAPARGPWGAAGYYWQTIMVYAGATWCPSLRKWLYVGAGHSALCVPAPLAFDAATLSWEWLDIPPPTDGLAAVASGTPTQADLSATYTQGQVDPAWGDWQGDSAAWGAYARPGRVFPIVSHSYYALAWIPGAAIGNTHGAMLHAMQPSGVKSGVADVRSGHYFDLDAMQWVRCANVRPGGLGLAAGGLVWDEGTQRAYAVGNVASGTRTTIEVWHPATKTWSQSSGGSVPITIDGAGLLSHPASGLLLLAQPEDAAGNTTYVAAVRQGIRAVPAADALAGGYAWTKLTVSETTWPTNAAGLPLSCGWAYCPANGCYYAIACADNSSTLWKLSPPVGAVTQADHLTDTWSVTSEALTTPIRQRGTSGGANASRVYNRMQWDALTGCFLYVEEWPDARVQAIRPQGT